MYTSISITFQRDMFARNCRRWNNIFLRAMTGERINAKKPFRISIEGNIGSGKTTLLEYFFKFSNITIHCEPISVWRNVQGYNLVELLYKDLNRWNMLFQNFIQLSRLSLHTNKSDNKIQMFERSLHNNRFCFIEMAHGNGQLNDAEYAILCEWYEWLSKNVDIQLDLVVYVWCPPEIAYERVLKRDRAEERGVISLEYLSRLHDAHQRWLLENPPAPVIKLDTSGNLSEVVGQYAMLEQIITRHKEN